MRPRQQEGGATLGSALLIAALIIAVCIGASQIAIGEQRSMANEVRGQVASLLAEMMVDRGAAYLRRNAGLIAATDAEGWMSPAAKRWQACAPTQIAPPCGDGRQNRYDARWLAYATAMQASADAGSGRLHYLALAAGGAPAPGTVVLVGEASTRDGGGYALVQQVARIGPIVAHVPAAPLMSGGDLFVEGEVSVVANPDADGHASALSAWARGDVSWSDAARSCDAAEFAHTAADVCPATGTATLSDALSEGADVLDVDGNQGDNADTTSAPRDLLESIFGIGRASWPVLRSQAMPLDDCSALGSASSGLYWIRYNCVLAAKAVAGSAERPVVLVVDGGDLSLGAGSRFHGLVFLLSHGALVPAMQGGAGAMLLGAVASDGQLQVGGGPWALVYRPELVAAITQPPGAPMGLSLVPGSWRDF